MIRRKEEKIYKFSLIISPESLINQSVWGWGGVLSVTPQTNGKNLWKPCSAAEISLK